MTRMLFITCRHPHTTHTPPNPSLACRIHVGSNPPHSTRLGIRHPGLCVWNRSGSDQSLLLHSNGAYECVAYTATRFGIRSPCLCVWNRVGTDNSLMLPYTGAFEAVAHSVQLSPVAPIAAWCCRIMSLGQGRSGVCDRVCVELVCRLQVTHTRPNPSQTRVLGVLLLVVYVTCVFACVTTVCACGTQMDLM